MLKIVGLGGSLRENSLTYQVLKKGLQFAGEMGAAVELLDLREMHLPFCDGSKDYPAYPDVNKLRDAIKSAHAIILTTPEYHGSVSGVLKNALDLLDFEHVEGKVFALIAVLGGIPSTNAVNTLRTICRSLHAWVLPEQIIISHAYEAFDDFGEFIDPHQSRKVQELIHKLLDTTQKLYAGKT